MDQDTIETELQFKAIRSSGSGGQHANKVSSKVELQFNVLNSNGLSQREKNRILLKLEKRLTKESVLILQCDESRSQHKNKELVIHRFFKLIINSLKVAKEEELASPLGHQLKED